MANDEPSYRSGFDYDDRNRDRHTAEREENRAGGFGATGYSAGGWPAGSEGYGATGFGGTGYAGPTAYGATTGYGPTSGYSGATGYGTSAGYGGTAGYGTSAYSGDYGAASGYGGAAGWGAAARYGTAASQATTAAATYGDGTPHRNYERNTGLQDRSTARGGVTDSYLTQSGLSAGYSTRYEPALSNATPAWRRENTGERRYPRYTEVGTGHEPNRFDEPGRQGTGRSIRRLSDFGAYGVTEGPGASRRRFGQREYGPY